MSNAPIEVTGWLQISPTSERRRYYTTAGGRFYEKEEEENVFYDQQDNAISYAAAEEAGLTDPSRYTEPASSGAHYQLGPSTSQPEDEAEEDYEEVADKLKPLPRTIGTLDPDQPLSGPVAADLKSVQSQTTVHLPRDYEEKLGKFFQVFRYLCSEAMGTTAPSQSDNGDGGTNNQSIYSTLRPMIVVKKLEAHAICVPIFSHGGQGVGKHGLRGTEVQRHAIVHMVGRTPEFVKKEQHWVRMGKIMLEEAFTVHPAPGASLHKASRIRFDSPYTVKYNLKVLDLGVVLRAHRQRLQEYWRSANA